MNLTIAAEIVDFIYKDKLKAVSYKCKAIVNVTCILLEVPMNKYRH